MAGAPGTTDAPVMRRLLAQARRFPFFQALRLLEAARPDAAPIGGEGPAQREAIRLRPSADCAFPASDVVEIREVDGGPSARGPRFQVTTSFLGLYGADSPLPAYFSEAVLWQNDESTRREFLDVFHHRLLSLFYRAWLKYRYALRFHTGGTDELSRLLLGLVGVATDGCGAAVGIEPVHLLHYAGLVGSETHSARGLECVVSDELGGVAVRVEECAARWVTIAAEQLARLGTETARLGETAVIGRRVFDRAGKFALRIGPVSLALFEALLPDGTARGPCLSLIQYYLRDPLAFDMHVQLHRAEVPPLRLGATHPAPRLGWTTWLGTCHEDPVACLARVA
jgi:type VI secretion system protein ImpH